MSVPDFIRKMTDLNFRVEFYRSEPGVHIRVTTSPPFFRGFTGDQAYAWGMYLMPESFVDPDRFAREIEAFAERIEHDVADAISVSKIP